MRILQQNAGHAASRNRFQGPHLAVTPPRSTSAQGFLSLSPHTMTQDPTKGLKPSRCGTKAHTIRGITNKSIRNPEIQYALQDSWSNRIIQSSWYWHCTTSRLVWFHCPSQSMRACTVELANPMSTQVSQPNGSQYEEVKNIKWTKWQDAIPSK